MTDQDTTQVKTRMLTFRGGGWVLVLSAIICLALMTWALLPALLRERVIPVAHTPDDFGFDLAALTVPKSDLITTSLHHTDALPMWDHPPLVPAESIGEQIRFGRKKYLVSTDRVIGVTINGESRAYPVRVLTVHEIINDTVAGVPIAVTYHPWCDSVAVFSREYQGDVIELGHSGMVLDSNAVIFDRNENRLSSSLFLQITGKPIAGPAVGHGASLTVLPCVLTTWADWRATNPETSVIGWDERLVKRYQGSDPDPYFRSPKLQFPVDPLPASEPIAHKDLVLAVTIEGQRRVFPLALLARRADASGAIHEKAGSASIEIRYDAINRCAVYTITPPTSDVQAVYALWFAWFAANGDADVVGLESSIVGKGDPAPSR